MEIPTKFKLCPEEWIPDTGLVTAALKIRRRQIHDFYKIDIDRMYGSSKHVWNIFQVGRKSIFFCSMEDLIIGKYPVDVSYKTPKRFLRVAHDEFSKESISWFLARQSQGRKNFFCDVDFHSLRRSLYLESVQEIEVLSRR